MRRSLACLLVMLLVCSARVVAAEEHWRGEVELPNGVGLEITVHVERIGALGEAAATIDIPLQGVDGMALDEVVWTADELAFEIAAAGAVFKLERDGDAAEGTLDQLGQQFPVALRRLAPDEIDDAEPKRPQEPKPPFPYAELEVTVESVDSVTLAGTLTIPEGGGRHPAAVLVTGSGPQDRDEALMGHRPFAVLADHLARRGIATLRVDDRGVGGSTGRFQDATSADFALDAGAAVAFLTERPEIDAAQVGIIGHSEGGLVAPMVAAERDDVAFIVLLAGTGVPGREILVAQVRAILAAAGAKEPLLSEVAAAQRAVLQAIVDEAPREELRPLVRTLVVAQAGGPEALPPDAEGVIDAQIDAQLAMVQSPWFRSFLVLDPAESLERVTCPTLVLNGSLDVQVVAAQNVGPIVDALLAGGNSDVTAHVLPGLNHLFQRATRGTLDEYARIETTIEPEVLELISDWIRARTGLAPG